MRSSRILVAGVVLACFSPLTAAAQPAPASAPRSLAETLTGQAKADYDAARNLFGDEDFEGARVKFERAFDESGDVRLLWNMAVCEKSLRHYVRVLHLLQRYEREGVGRITIGQRVEADNVMRAVKDLISSVLLSVDQPDAEVSVDDEVVGRTPLSEPLYVDLGTRRIRIRKPGYIEKIIIHDFAGNSEAAFDVRLRAEPHDARLAVVAAPDASVLLDGTFMGVGSWQGTILAGEHMLRVTAPDKVPYRRDVVLKVGEARRLQIDLEPQRSGVSPLIWIGAGLLAAGGIATFTYFMLKPNDGPRSTSGTLDPFKIVVN
jgi:hypothetical protein